MLNIVAGLVFVERVGIASLFTLLLTIIVVLARKSSEREFEEN